MRLTFRGHNLLEVVIAVTIFSTAVILFLGVWSHYYSAQTLGRNRLAAASLARALMEQRVATGFRACDPAIINSLGPGVVLSESEVRGKPTSCRMVYEFYSEDRPPQNRFRRLRVRVQWEDYVGGQKVQSYETYLYRTN